MSSDDYFDDSFDEEAFAQIDAIEAVYTASASEPQASTSKQPAAPTPRPATAISRPSRISSQNLVFKEDSFYDLTLDLDDEDFEMLDNFTRDSYAGNAKPIGHTRQTTLFGDVLPNSTQAQGLQKTASVPRNKFGSKPRKTKKWDQTAFAKSGNKKGKGKSFGDEEEEDERVEFEQFPAPFVSPDQPPPMKLQPDLLAVKHWHYPLNKPKRTYQYDIVKKSLFENTIISIPTGLGKTFIAGVIMLNYYRWFPKGKVVFVAPTKPLVAQQINASHQSCGIPGYDAAEMTGEIPRAKRERLWQEKRVFYMTPQTLMNDLATQNCDVMDIILLVVDEAHRATGDYAYNQIVRWMMAKNPHFRLIALTATPGRDPAAVQNLVDGLHISHIEIRDENSIDIAPHLQEKDVQSDTIKMPPEIILIRDSLAALMDTYLRPLKARGIMWPEQSAIKLHPYAARAKMTSLAPDQRGFIGQLSMLGNLAQVMGFLLEGTVGMAFSYLKEVSQKDSDEHASKNQQAQSKRLRDNDLFKRTLEIFEGCRQTPTSLFPLHPKMEKTVDLLVDYYGQRLGENDKEGGSDSHESRAMVFASHRELVDEIVEALNAQKPMIRASKFVGQAIDKHGKKGQAQKEQLETIQKFQSGDFNVLVATCIGEEGLDIGEVDLIICYDTQKTPIRMLQRFGRTGRKRAGRIHVLLAEDREEFNLEKARTLYKEVQKSICRGDDLEFYADVERLIPDHIKPECRECVMDIHPYTPEERSKVKQPPPKASTANKRKRNDDMMRNIPTGASTGFVNVAELIIKQSKNRKTVSEKTLEEAGEDDDLDRELDAGVDGILHGKKRTQSIPVTWDDNLENPAGKSKLKRASTENTTKSKPRKKKKDFEEGDDETKVKEMKVMNGKGKGKARGRRKEAWLTLSQQGRDDSLDRELEQEPLELFKKSQKMGSLSPDLCPPSPRLADEHTEKLLNPLREDNLMMTPDKETERHRSEMHVAQEGSCWKDQGPDKSMAWLVDDDDEPDIVILSSSPAVPKNDNCDQSIEPLELKSSKPQLPGVQHKSPLKSQTQVPNDEVLELSSEADISMVPSPTLRCKSKSRKSTSPFLRTPESLRLQPSPDNPTPEDSQPIRHRRRIVAKRHLVIDGPSSDAEEMPPPRQHRLRRYEDGFEPRPEEWRLDKKFKTPTKRKHNPWLEYSAEHSGGEVSAGSSNSDDDVESDSDRLFIKDSPMTQMSPSYNQMLAYRKGLMTQTPGDGPVFNGGPVRSKPFGRMEPNVRRVIDSSPPPADDDYEFGSFVVDNDAEISYLTQADNSL